MSCITAALGSLVADRAANRLLLLGVQAATLTLRSASPGGLERGRAARLIQVDGQSHCRVAQARQLDDFHHTVAFDMQPHDLLSPFVQLLQTLIASVFFVHATQTRQAAKSSAFNVPNQ